MHGPGPGRSRRPALSTLDIQFDTSIIIPVVVGLFPYQVHVCKCCRWIS